METNNKTTEQIKQIISKRYIICENGLVYSKKTKKVKKFFITHNGYLKARMYLPELSNNDDNGKPFYLHRLVAIFHLPTFSDTLQINHKDGDKTNNHISNLEMVTASENHLHAWRVLDSTSRREALYARRLPNGKFGKNKQ
jgi:hypothetical protein